MSDQYPYTGRWTVTRLYYHIALIWLLQMMVQGFLLGDYTKTSIIAISLNTTN